MVLLTLTTAAYAAVKEYCRLQSSDAESVNDTETKARSGRLSQLELGSPVEHSDLIEISKSLVEHKRRQSPGDPAKEWRLDSLLRGAEVYQPPPPPKPEPVSNLRSHETADIC